MTVSMEQKLQIASMAQMGVWNTSDPTVGAPSGNKIIWDLLWESHAK